MERVKLDDKPIKKKRGKDDRLVIMVNEDWRLEYDDLQFIVQKRQFNEVQKTHYWSRKAYCSNLDHAIYFLAKNKIYMTPGIVGPEAMEHILKTLDEIKADCKRAMQEGLKMLAKRHKK